MTELENTVNQAIADFDGIKKALEESGVDVPYDTDTSEYGKLIRSIPNFDDGYEAGQNTIYDIALRGGERTSCENAFIYWDMEYIRPPFVWKPTSRTVSCFQNCRYLKKIEKQYLDFSGCSASGTSTSGHYNTVMGCGSLEVFEDIGLSVTGEYYQTWRANGKLHTIELVRSNKATKYTNTFYGCSELIYIRFEGEIGQNISFSSCGKLSNDSINDIIDHLADLTGETAKTISWHSSITPKLTGEQWQKIANKNWMLG